jgi:hypothetical protein
MDSLRSELTTVRSYLREVQMNAYSGAITRALGRIAQLEATLEKQEAYYMGDRKRIAELEEALRPFTQPDLYMLYNNNVQGDDSPVLVRDKAMLKLGDFRKAAALLREGE